MSKIGLAALALTIGATCMATESKAAPYVYAVTVKTSFGTTIQDCFTFNGSTLLISGLQTKLPYTAAPTTPKYYYVAVTTPAYSAESGESYAFAGFKTGTNVSGHLSAVGSSSNHDSYTVSGKAVPSCSLTPEAVRRGGSPYLQAQK